MTRTIAVLLAAIAIALGLGLYLASGPQGGAPPVSGEAADGATR